MTSASQAVELRDGSLRFDPGGPVPEVPPGYSRDTVQPWRMNLTAVPNACADRRTTPCRHGLARWWCRRDSLPVNPGACCRCQGIL